VGKLESWIGQQLRPLTARVAAAKAKAVALAVDRESKIEHIILDNVKMRQQIGQLTNIIEQLKAMPHPGPVVHEPDPKPDDNPPPAMDVKHYEEDHRVRVENVALKTRFNILSQQLMNIRQTLGTVPLVQTESLLRDAHRTCDIGVRGPAEQRIRPTYVPDPNAVADTTMDAQRLANHKAVSFDDEQLKDVHG
jgi:hypothetical protein